MFFQLNTFFQILKKKGKGKENESKANLPKTEQNTKHVFSPFFFLVPNLLGGGVNYQSLPHIKHLDNIEHDVYRLSLAHHQ